MLRIRHRFALTTALVLGLIPATDHVVAQCSDYEISMPNGAGDDEISWSLVDQNGVVWVTGGAPFDGVFCLPDGCYALLMFDSVGDGWDGLDWDIEAVDDNWHDHATLHNGQSQDFDQMELGTGDCNNAALCPDGQSPFYLSTIPGGSPGQVSWSVQLNGTTISVGGASTLDTLCLGPGCLVLTMNDSGNNGWEGTVFMIKNAGGAVIYGGTLPSGSSATVNIPVNGGNCIDPGGGGPGGGGVLPGTGPGGGCGPQAPGGDCAIAGCACDPYQFDITPSGFGNVNEVPPPGSVSNPSFFGAPPWGGTAQTGCLLAGELNSTWITFTIATSGTLQFAFAAGGQQVGFYDWAMWPLIDATTCATIANNTLQPVRCVWNATTVGGTGLSSPVPPGGNPGNYATPLAVTAGQRFIICLSNWSFVNATVTLDFFGTAGIQCGQTPLPIELLSFSAMKDGQGVLTSWATATELNNDHFEVQRSMNGSQWNTIGSVRGAGTTQSTHFYDMTDPEPAPGINYYRLKQVDVDGSSSYSEVEAVAFTEADEALIWPQPSQGDFHISGLEEAPIVLDALGRRIAVDITRNLSSGYFDVHIRNPVPGLYLVADATGAGTIGMVIVRE
ncbi:MAG: hypothetical protein ABI432_02530 [Flavobacteriales bacterium]